MMHRIIYAMVFVSAFPWVADAQDANWSAYLGGPESGQYSTLDQIHTGNVDQLEVAWTYHTGGRPGQIQCNPLVIDGVLYGTSPTLKVFALDAATGEELWVFDVDEREATRIARVEAPSGVPSWSRDRYYGGPVWSTDDRMLACTLATYASGGHGYHYYCLILDFNEKKVLEKPKHWRFMSWCPHPAPFLASNGDAARK